MVRRQLFCLKQIKCYGKVSVFVFGVLWCLEGVFGCLKTKWDAYLDSMICDLTCAVNFFQKCSLVINACWAESEHAYGVQNAVLVDDTRCWFGLRHRLCPSLWYYIVTLWITFLNTSFKRAGSKWFNGSLRHGVVYCCVLSNSHAGFLL